MKRDYGFVARRSQLEQLVARRKAAASGRGSVVLVSGEAGSGKTLLLKQFAVAVAPHHKVWISSEHFTAPPLSSLEAAMKDKLKRSTVIIVEDAQDAPPALLEALCDIGKVAENSRLLLVVSYRSPEINRNRLAMIALGKLARLECAASIDLEPLTRAEIRELVHALTNEGACLGSGWLETIERKSGGNPLLVRLLVTRAGAEGQGGEQDLPLAVRGIVAEWLLRLTEPERRVLRYAALMRGPFDAACIAAVAVAPIRSVAMALGHASEHAILNAGSGGDATYSFRHGVVAQVLEHEFLPHELRQLHATIADAMEASGVAPNHADELAEHWHEAGKDERAAGYGQRAGDYAFAAGNYERAAHWYERAVQFARATGAPLGDLYEKLARSLERSGHASASHEALRQAANRLEAAGNTDRAARLRIHDAIVAQYQSDLTAGLSRIELAVTHDLPSTSQRYAQAVAAFLLALRHQNERALDLLDDFPKDDGVVEAAALSKYWEVIGYTALQRCNPPAAREAYRMVLKIAQQDGDPALVAEAQTNCAIYEMAFGEPSCDALFARAIVMAQEHGLPAVEAYARGYAAVNDFVRGRLNASKEHLLAMLPIAAHAPVAIVSRTYAGLSTGRAVCDDALVAACARPELIELAFSAGSAGVFGRAAGPYAQWLVDNGRVAEARSVLHRCICGLRNAYGTFLTMPVVAMYADAPDVAAARAVLSSAAENPHDRIAAATLLLFGALWKRRVGEDPRAFASDAAMRYESLGWAGMQAWALELAGNVSGALNLYRGCGNLREVRRLELSQRQDGPLANQKLELLSARERKIVALVADGKSNRAISATLALSEKTVEGYLTSIFNKLGFRSRTELAAFTVANRLTL